MNPFEPASLSPLAKTLVPCPLPYDLTWDDLRNVLPGFEATEHARIRVYSAYEKQGLNGGSNSCILSFSYPTAAERIHSETIFMKCTTEAEKTEARKYQTLESLSIPTPRLLAAIYKNNCEIILLEFLPKIGIDFSSNDEVNNLLHLAAQLNAIQNPPELFDQPGGIPQAEFDEHVRVALKEIARDRSFSITVDIPRWFDAYQIARVACKSMPRALNHNEFSFQQVGRVARAGKNQLVVFDLETMSLSPRFTDIAGILPHLARYTRRNQIELFKIYFDRLCELSSLELEIDAAFHEMRLVQVKGAFDSLPWLVDVAKQPDLNEMLDNPLLHNVNNLNDSLVALGFL